MKTAHPINARDSLAPFLVDIAAAGDDIMMCGHVDCLLRTASKRVCGDETRKVVEFKPGNATAVRLEGQGNDGYVTYAWHQDHTSG